MNPDAQANAEVIARSYIPEAAVNTGALNREQRARQEKATSLRQLLETTGDPITVLKESLEPSKERTDLATIDTDKEVKRRIHAPEKDSNGTVIDTEQEALLNRAIALAKEAKAIAEKGLDGIVDVNGNIDTARQQVIIDLYVSRVLDSRSAFSALSPIEKSAIAKAELQKPSVRQKVAELLKQRLSASEQPTEADRELSDKEKGKKTKKAEAKEAKKKLKKAERTLRELETVQAEHSFDPNTNVEGSRYQAIRELGNRIDVQYIKELRAMLISKKTPQDFESDKALVYRKMTTGATLGSEYEQFIAELIVQERLITQQNALIAERDSIDEKVKEAKKEKKKAVKARQNAKREVSELDEEIDELEEPRDRREENLVRSLEGIIAEAGNQTLNQDNNARVQAFEKDAREKTEATNDADEKLIYSGIATRWERVVIINGQRVIEEVPRQRDVDWEAAINTGDVTNQVEEMLTRHVMINRHIDSRKEVHRKGIEARRIKNRLKTDEAFKLLATSEYLTNLIGKRLETGETFSDGEFALIEDYDWMPYAEQYITEKDEKDKEFGQKIDQLVQQAGVDQPEKLAALQEKYGDNWASILAILMSGADIPTDPKIGIFDRLRRIRSTTNP